MPRAALSRSKLTRDQRGAVAVEFAIVLPLLVLLIFGIIEFGRAYNAKIALEGAVREGARILAVGNGDPVAATKGAAASLDPGTLSVSTSGQPCTAGTEASVTASYPFEYTIPLYGSATLTLSSTGVMRCGG
ncbi:MAG: pilus assembly protein [Actinobacteria bacterium]|nr:pilus assembly protein [Actinomycetota bacterium]